MIKQLFFWIVILFIIPMTIKAQWSAVNRTDPFTDEEIAYALYSDSLHDIQLSEEDGRIWMFITKKVGTFEPDGLIELRVDKYNLRKIDPPKMRELGKLLHRTMYNWEPSTIGFNAWAGDTTGGSCGFIDELILGETLIFRYEVSSLEKEAYRISLSNADTAIYKGLGLTHCGLTKN